jgi:hypothetical protein
MTNIVTGVADLWRQMKDEWELKRTVAQMDDHMRADIGLPPRGPRIVPSWRLHPYY